MSSQPLFWQFVNLWAWVIPATAALAINHCLVSIVMVGLGIWPEISQWRPLFGSWMEAYTVERLWSRTWHQMLRRSLTTPGHKLGRYLSIPEGTILSSLVILYTSFFISAWIHHAGDYMMLGHHADALKFFLSQAVVITLEKSIVALGRRVGFTNSYAWRILGYVWVQLWFLYSLPWWLQPHIDAGLIQNGMPYSLILGLWKGDWMPGHAASSKVI